MCNYKQQHNINKGSHGLPLNFSYSEVCNLMLKLGSVVKRVEGMNQYAV